jgi:hypothetical protein
VPPEDETSGNGDLKAAKARLTKSLKKCRALVAECRSRLSHAPTAGKDDTPIFRWDRKSDS